MLVQRAPSGGEPQALGRSRGGFSTKIHVAVDALGNPVDFILTEGQAADNPQAQVLLKGKSPEYVLADKAYDADDTIKTIENQRAIPVIPPKANRKHQRECDFALYKERHLVECFIGKIKHFRRVFSRFDKRQTRFLAFLHFVSTIIWLR